MSFSRDRDSDVQGEDDKEVEDYALAAVVSHYVGAPVRFFAKFGILGLPFIFAYWLFLTVAGTAIVIGAIWGGVVALFYVLFG